MLQSILANLPCLTEKELEVVQAAIAMLGRKPEEEVPQLYTAMVSILGSKIPYSKFRQQEVYKQWKQNLPGIMEFVTATWQEASQDVVRLGLLRYLLGLLVEDLRRRGVPVLPRTVVLGLPEIPALFECAFPGYRASGLSHLVVKMLVRA